MVFQSYYVIHVQTTWMCMNEVSQFLFWRCLHMQVEFCMLYLLLHTGSTTTDDTECSDDFYLDNSSGLCRPECGEWDQYTSSSHDRVVGINITFVLLTILICVATLVWSIVRHKIMWAAMNKVSMMPHYYLIPCIIIICIQTQMINLNVELLSLSYICHSWKIASSLFSVMLMGLHQYCS